MWRQISRKHPHDSPFYDPDKTIGLICEDGFLEAIRSHWAMENNLHWFWICLLEKICPESEKTMPPQIMAVIRHIALNLLQLTKDKMKRQSIKRLRKMAGWDHALLSTIFSQNFS